MSSGPDPVGRRATSALGGPSVLQSARLIPGVHAAAFVPDNATWVILEQTDGLTLQAADTETLLAMKIAAERDKATLDITRLFRRLNITKANDAVDLAYDKQGDHSIPLALWRELHLRQAFDAGDVALPTSADTKGNLPPL
ncbi:hypothetical protein ACSBOX_11260 [Arthrobacter sp. KN11-1C]|uniref:hypothetical protein n=1 Tax=Arthrobacter sp. KN11-1C TaxID=3445774 RepID=UPI003FA112C7